MSTVISNGTIVVVKAKQDRRGNPSGVAATAYRDELQAVCSMIDNGSLGGGGWYGCEEHKAALEKVEQQIAATRESMEQMENDDAEGDTNGR